MPSVFRCFVHGPVVHHSPGTGRSPYQHFPSLNDVIRIARKSAYESNSQKRSLTELVKKQVREAADEQRWIAPDGPVAVGLLWHEGNRRRDADNVASAQKFVMDGLVEAGVLRGDDQRHVPQPPVSAIVVDPDSQGVDVVIERLGTEHGRD
jgi:hypothetical protein